VAWSPDGKRVASASDDKTVQVWDAADGGHLFTYMGHTSPMRSVAWSPQNNYIASVSADSLVHVWNAADGNARFALVKSQPWDSSILDTNPEIVNMIAWSPNDQYIAAASYEKDGDGSYNRIYIFSSRNALRQNYNSKGSGSVSSIVWSPNSLRMAYAINENQAGPEPPHIVAIGSVGGGERIFPSYTGHKNTIRTVAWSSDGKLIASAGDESTVHLWNANDKKRLFTYTGHSDIIYAVAWSPIDTEYIASASEDRTVQVWKTA
jgi:WD40 repeat protein